MASVFALRATLAITLGLGSLDLAAVTLVLGPPVVADEPTPLRFEPPQPAPPEPVATPPVAEPIEVTVYFATDRADLDADSRRVLEALVREATDVEVTLEGHADRRGPEALNLALSKARASAVADHLVALGIERARIAVGFVGARQSTGELWRDRRVDIRIIPGGAR